MKKVLFIINLTLAFSTVAQEKKDILYVGTYSVRGSEGIYVLEFDPKASTLKIVQTVSSLESPTFLDIHPSGKFLYSVNRGGINGNKKTGSVSSYSINPETKKLKVLNSVPSVGLGPCHIAVHPSGKTAIVSQYAEGTLGVYSLLDDGSLDQIIDSIRYSGYGPNSQQQSPHIHSATFSPGNQFVLVPDLGSDKIYSYQSSISDGKLVATDQSFIITSPGTGPRHLSFSKNRKFFYLTEELTSTVAAFSFDERTGSIKMIEDQIKSLPGNFSGANTAADIHTSPDGKFLYMSNRGSNSLAIFSILKNGKLRLIGHQETMGNTPRNFMITSNGAYLFVANQDSDNIVAFKRNKKNGTLTYAGIDLKIPSPVCIVDFH